MKERERERERAIHIYIYISICAEPVPTGRTGQMMTTPLQERRGAQRRRGQSRDVAAQAVPALRPSNR
jgi:hypothetical protein